MNKSRLLLNAGVLLGLPLLGLHAAHAAEYSVPADKPLNLARSSNGARLTIQAPATVKENTAPRAAQALLTDDDPLGYELATGSTDVLLALPRAELVHRLNFLNLTAAGRVSVAVSTVQLPADSPRWRSVCKAQAFGDANEVVTCDLGSEEAKYVKITLDVRAPGRIDTLGLFGRTTVAQSAGQPAGAGQQRMVGYEFLDYGNIAAQSRIVRTSSGPGTAAADGMIDGNLKTSYAFAASDKHPMAVIDLGTNRALTRVSVAYKAGAGRLDFYLLPDPAQRSGFVRTNASYAGQSATIPEMSPEAGFPGDRKAVGSITTDGRAGLNRSSVALTGESGRYLAVVFTPRGGGGSGGIARGDVKDFKDFKDFKDGAAEDPARASEAPLEVSEITVFGPPPGTFTSVTDLPPTPATPFFPPPSPEGPVVTP